MSTEEKKEKRLKPVYAEYIWTGSSSPVDVRSKTKVLMIEVDNDDKPVGGVDLPIWAYDGSSCNQTSAKDSEVLLNPVAVHSDPFRGSPHVMVLCDTFKASDKQPLESNTRVGLFKKMENVKDEKLAFGIEQEYFLVGKDLVSGDDVECANYCGPCDKRCRRVMEMHLQACGAAGLTMSGCNAEVARNQFEFQVGPLEALQCCDQLIVARHLLNRVAESEDLRVEYNAKPSTGENGSGCHFNMSTNAMREEEGLDKILDFVDKMKLCHAETVAVCGQGTHERLTGTHETSSYDQFSMGYGDRTCSVRISELTKVNEKGHLEDRRPSSTVDPYAYTNVIVENCFKK